MIKQLIWYVFAGTRGGITRVRIVSMLDKEPQNAHKLAKKLKLDYKTIRHHIDVLLKNKMIVSVGKDSYGAIYFLSDELKKEKREFDIIRKKMGGDLGKR